MPLPILTPTTKISNTNKPTQLRLQSQKPSVKLRQDAAKRQQKTVNNPDDEPDSSTTTESITVSQSSSRIPSPLKRHEPNLSVYDQQPQSARGHTRQKSAAASTIISNQASRHARSISAISVKSTPALGHETRPLNSKLAYTTKHSQSARALPAQVKPTSTSTRSTLRSDYGSLHEESLRNELFQLSLVHVASGTTLQRYQQNLNDILAAQKAQVQAKRANVLRLRLAHSAVVNTSALDLWAKLGDHQNLCQLIQNLSIVVRDVQVLEQIFAGDHRLAWAFDKWYNDITTPLNQVVYSHNHDDYTSSHVKFEEHLRLELIRFERRTAPLLATLANLPNLPGSSSLAFIVRSHASLVENLRLQCQTMLQVGQHLTNEHKNWLDNEVVAAIQDCKSSSRMASQAAGAWES